MATKTREPLVIGTAQVLHPRILKPVLEVLDRKLAKAPGATVAFEMFDNHKPTSARALLRSNPKDPYLAVVAKHNGKVVSADNSELQETEKEILRQIYGFRRVNRAKKQELRERNTHNIIKRSAHMLQRARNTGAAILICGVHHGRDIKRHTTGVTVLEIPGEEILRKVFSKRLQDEDLTAQMDLALREKLLRNRTYSHLFRRQK
ncbi:MAG: hypothetical protein V1644_00270 [Candidatus Micrarchaeota archaeon]